MEVLFPAGSLALVEGIYRGNALTDYYNGILAASVASLVRAASGPVRIVEVGGGTGGTTHAILHALASTNREVEYVFTDVSQAFLRTARNRWEHQYPFVSYELLDV